MKRMILHLGLTACLALVLIVGGGLAASDHQPAGLRAGTAQAAETLKSQFFLPKRHPIAQRLERLYKQIEKDTGGEIKIRGFYASELVPLRQALDGLSKGTLDMLVGPGNYYSGKIAIADFGIMPLNFRTAGDRYKAFYDEGLGDILDKVYGKSGIKVAAPFVYMIGEEILISKRVKFNGYDDLKGLKLRVAGGELIEMVKALGAKPAFVAPPEMYTALQRGTVDGAVFPAHDLRLLKLSEVVGTVVGPDYLFSGPMMHLVKFNRNTWNRLSPSMRDKVSATLRSAAREDDMNSQKQLTDLYRDAAEKAGVKFVTLSASDIAKARKASMAGREAYLRYNREQGHGAEAEQVLSILDRLSGL